MGSPRDPEVEVEEEEEEEEPSLVPVTNVPDVARVSTLLRRSWELAV